MAIIGSSCTQESTESVVPNLESEDKLALFFRNFEHEALERNIEINLDELNLTAEIQEIHEEHVAGTCKYSSHTTNHITIDLSFWNSADRLTREMVVFHELGHCVLGQDHREYEDENGNCLSIMQSGTQGCQLLYNQSNRSYYLDELFEHAF